MNYQYKINVVTQSPPLVFQKLTKLYEISWREGNPTIWDDGIAYVFDELDLGVARETRVDFHFVRPGLGWELSTTGSTGTLKERLP